MTQRLSDIGWEAFLWGSRRELLPGMDWQVDLFGPEGREVNLRASVPGWEEITWAEQVFLQAAYGFQGDGRIVLTQEDLRDRNVLEALIGGTRREAEDGTAWPEPGRALPGADTRLRLILSEHTGWEWMKAREDTVAWMDPDGSVILTCPEGWGIPGLVEREPGLYCEFGDSGRLCGWQLDWGEQPGWSLDPPMQARDGLRPLGPEWQPETPHEAHGVRQTRYRRQRQALGEIILETDDGNHLLRWRTRYTRATRAQTTHPLGRSDWTLRMLTSQQTGTITIKSDRDGTSEKLGTTQDHDIACLMAHEHVRRHAGR